ncbi:hypothetical protein DFH94DRAFT_82836 [Russula ochroleuca]|uniref:Uncharacterized protein n=1 Tax=Russula ochroleuca TaxID=152965 RepID=A0A9P5MTF7_9AGAM|nr:hypothetical protein DFH94DRAFT_82836 [Russula ochroleuca]
MGGKAFLSHLPDATFPRLPPLLYASLKSSLLPRLTPLFQYVDIPHEAPEKEDHGDIDFIVACPHTAVGHEEIKSALGAVACIPSAQPDGGGSHNFALRLADVVTPLPTDAVPVPGETTEVYVQVDVNIRKDEKDWENVMIFHSYGDLGMIMGRLAASVGLHWGELGLKVTSQALVPTYSPYFLLSTSIPDTFPFFGLSMERWKAGFETQQEAFEWVTSSRFYVFGQISDKASRVKSRANRGMYQAFLQWSDSRVIPAAANEGQPQEKEETEDSREAVKESVRGEALAFFGKREDHDALVQANEKRVRLKAIWNGRKVGEWIGGNRLVGRVMALMRQTMGEEKIGQMTEEELKQHVLQANETVELQVAEERQAREEAEEAEEELKRHVLQANETVDLQIAEERQAREEGGEDVDGT